MAICGPGQVTAKAPGGTLTKQIEQINSEGKALYLHHDQAQKQASYSEGMGPSRISSQARTHLPPLCSGMLTGVRESKA